MRSRTLSLLQALVLGVVLAVAAALVLAAFGLGAWMVIRWISKRFATR